MPRVGKKTFPYTPAGKQAAAKARKAVVPKAFEKTMPDKEMPHGDSMKGLKDHLKKKKAR